VSPEIRCCTQLFINDIKFHLLERPIGRELNAVAKGASGPGSILVRRLSFFIFLNHWLSPPEFCLFHFPFSLTCHIRQKIPYKFYNSAKTSSLWFEQTGALWLLVVRKTHWCRSRSWRDALVGWSVWLRDIQWTVPGWGPINLKENYQPTKKTPIAPKQPQFLKAREYKCLMACPDFQSLFLLQHYHYIYM